MQKVHHSIKTIERRIDHVKLLNRLGKVTHADARKKIKDLEKELQDCIDELPVYERSVYRIKKEFGKDF